MNPKEEIARLTALLEEANHKYYVLDAPTMADFEYDRLLRQLEELEARVRALEEGGASGGGETGDTVAEYVPGKWYYAGDRVTFEGKRYVCSAPKGVVCVWSPGVFPAYWEAEA